MSQALVIWRFIDGKPGHENQTLGLVQAMQRESDCRVIDIPVVPLRLTIWCALLSWLLRRFPRQPEWPAPDWIIAAGHATHLSLLCAQRSCGGRTVVLMKPSLPLSWFDHVVVPVHDEVSGANVISTRGVLNAMHPAEKQPGKTLVLVGGESKHFAWDDERVYSALKQLRQSSEAVTVTDSRRTPDALRQRLQAEFASQYQPWEFCPVGWLQAQLATAETAWVTEDSVSMIYEALSAGCRVGLIALAGGHGRLAQGISRLEADGLVVRWIPGEYQAMRALPARIVVLDEAARVAREILS